MRGRAGRRRSLEETAAKPRQAEELLEQVIRPAAAIPGLVSALEYPL